MTCSKGGGKKSSLGKYLRAPLRIVVGVGDLCVQSLTGNVVYGNSMGCPTPHTPALPRTPCSINSPASPSPSKYRPAAANRGKVASGGGKVAPTPARRSNSSVGLIETIDEDEEEALTDCDEH